LWEFEYSNRFVRQYKSLNSELQTKVKSSLNDLADSDNPSKLGEYKPSIKAYAYVLDRSNRILYNVRFRDNVIELIRVGSLKQVYGKD